MTGSSLLGVQSPDGQVAFTRRGDLTVDQAGLISTANGNVVLGEGGGPITAPVGMELAITDDGTVTATDPAQPDSPPTVVGNLLLRDATGVRMVRGSMVYTRRSLPAVKVVIFRAALIRPRFSPARWRARPSMWPSSWSVLWICLDRSRSRSK
jgi:flagellar basal body rod protein FlgG